MIAVFASTALCKYKRKRENKESLNRRAVSSSVHIKLAHVFAKPSRNDHLAHRAMSTKTNFNEDPCNTRSRPKTDEQRPKELIRTMRYRVNREPMSTIISISGKIYPGKILSSAV